MPLSKRKGSSIKAWRRPPRQTPSATTTMGLSFSTGPPQRMIWPAPTMEAIMETLKAAGARAGIKKTLRELRAPIKRAARETRVKKGAITRTINTVRRNLSRSWEKLGAKTWTIWGAATTIAREIPPVTTNRQTKRAHSSLLARSGCSCIRSVKMGTKAEEKGPLRK